MGAIVSNQPCLVCSMHEPIMHSHHTVPQCRGGFNSPQVILCPSCHNTIHGHALHLTAAIRNNSSTTKQFWNDARLEKNAEPLVLKIVQAFIQPLPEGVEIDIPLTFIVDSKTKKELQILQRDLGLSSMEKTINYCVQSTLKQKGVSSEKPTNMWFLPASGPR